MLVVSDNEKNKQKTQDLNPFKDNSKNVFKTYSRNFLPHHIFYRIYLEGKISFIIFYLLSEELALKLKQRKKRSEVICVIAQSLNKLNIHRSIGLLHKRFVKKRRLISLMNASLFF